MRKKNILKLLTEYNILRQSSLTVDDVLDPDCEFYSDIVPDNGAPFALQRKCISAYLNIERAKEAKYAVQMEIRALHGHYLTLHHNLEESYCFSSPGVSASLFNKLCDAERAINELSDVSKHILVDSLPAVNEYLKLVKKNPSCHDMFYSDDSQPEDNEFDLQLYSDLDIEEDYVTDDE